MARYNSSLNSFSAGELSPKLSMRTDIDQYPNGLKEMLNFIPAKSGGAFRRMGTEFLTSFSAGNTPSALVPYKGETEDYVIHIKLDNNDLGDDVNTLTAYDIDGNQEFVFGTAPGLYSVFNPKFSPSLDPNGFRYTQVGIYLYITHSSGQFAPIKLFRQYDPTLDVTYFFAYPAALAVSDAYGDLSVEKNIIRAMTLRPQNTNQEIQLRPSVTGGSSPGALVSSPVAVTVYSETSGGTPTNFFDANHVGAMFALEQGTASEGVFLVTGFTSATEVTGYILAEFQSTARSFRWSEGAFSKYRGYPETVAHFQGRLHWGGTLADPNYLFVSGLDEEDFVLNRLLNQDNGAGSDQSGLDYWGNHVATHPFSKGLSGSIQNKIQWMINDGDLRVGTNHSDFRISFSPEAGTGYERDNFQADIQSGTDAANYQPVLGDEKVLYVTKDGKRVRSIDSRTGDFKYRNLDISILADHMPYVGDVSTSDIVNDLNFKDTYWQDSASTLWLINGNDKLVGVTINQASNVVAWHQHEIGGLAGDDKIKSICSMYNPSTNHEDLVLLIRRDRGISSYNYIEKVGDTFNHPILNNDSTSTADKPAYLDSFQYVDYGSPVTEINVSTHFTHLAGETVDIYYDGKYSQSHTLPASGTYTLPEEATQVIIGYPYNSRLESLVLEAGQQFGTSRGNISRVDRVTISLYNSSSGLLGFEADNMNDIELEEDALYTGDVRHELAQTGDIEPRVIIETSKPLPLNVLGITTRGVSYDG